MKSREEIAKVLQEIKNLPTLPEVATKVIQLSDDPDVSPRDLAELVERDPSIATRLLKLINSPYFGIRGTVTSVQQALVFLGVSNLRNLVLSSSVMDLFDTNGSVGSFSRRGLWEHSMAVGICARELAKRTHSCDPETAFTAGLIHDVGKVVLDRYFHSEFTRIVELMDQHGSSMIDAEVAVLGMDHCDVGLYLTQRWSLPKILQEAVGCHHHPRGAREHGTLAALTGYADSVVRQLDIGDGGGAAPELDDEFEAILPMSARDLAAFAEQLADSLQEQVHLMTAGH